MYILQEAGAEAGEPDIPIDLKIITESEIFLDTGAGATNIIYLVGTVTPSNRHCLGRG